jgi:hypothetical protein
MLFKYDTERTIKCKVSKYIKTPFVKAKDSKPSECNVINDHILPFYTIMRSNHQTFFYQKINLVYFYESILNSDEKIVQYYDYQKERYCLTKQEHINKINIYSIITHFKATNEHTYFVYLTGLPDASDGKILVYDYTKNKIIYRRKSEWLDIYTFRVPILNSILISLSGLGEYIYIRIIDLTKEDEGEYVELFRVSLAQYFIDIINTMSDKISKDDISRLSKIAHEIIGGLSTYKDIEYIESYGITATANIHNINTVYNTGIQIRFDLINLKSLKTKIEYAFSISLAVENSKIVIKVGTGEDGRIIVNGNTIKLPSNVYWYRGEYELVNKYDLTKSKLYSVLKVSKEYMIVDDLIYYAHPKLPKTYKCYAVNDEISSILNEDDMSIIYNSGRYTIVLGTTNSKINYKAAVRVTSRYYGHISIINMHSLRNKIRQMKENNKNRVIEVIDSEVRLVKSIRIDHKVSKILHDLYRPEPLTNSYDYWYYVDEEKAYMYCLIIYPNASGDNRIILVRCHLENNMMPPVIMLYSEIKSDELQKNPKLLQTRIINLMAYQNGNPLHLYNLLEKYKESRNYSYMNEIISEMNYPLFSFKDIKYNRSKILEHYRQGFRKIDGLDIDRYHNVILWTIEGIIGRYRRKISVPFVISELIVTRKLLPMSNTC